MATEKLYWHDSYLKDFSAIALDVVEKKDFTEVILDRTAFYATSGGQMHDKGILEGCTVFDVKERENDIVHYVKGKVSQGDTVHGSLDWERRFDFMQQHAGFHILAQSFLRIAKAHTLSSHLGETASTIDLEVDEIASDVLKVDTLDPAIVDALGHDEAAKLIAYQIKSAVTDKEYAAIVAQHQAHHAEWSTRYAQQVIDENQPLMDKLQQIHGRMLEIEAAKGDGDTSGQLMLGIETAKGDDYTPGFTSGPVYI